MEKFIGFTIGRLQFMDSLQHLSSSLDKLVDNLADKTKIIGCKYCPRRGPKGAILRHQNIAHKGDNLKEFNHSENNSTLPELFPNLYNHFKKKWKKLPDQDAAFKMLTRKGVYPYSYMNGFEKFEETSLPPREKFFNDLSKKHISDTDYTFIHELWKTFNLKNLGELHDLYMETDVLLLADVFQEFRHFSLLKYRLDPAHFNTAPSLTWSAALLYTMQRLEIPIDPDMHLFFDKGLTGGASQVANPWAEANHEGIEKKL